MSLRVMFFLVWDLFLSLISLVLAYLLRFNFEVPPPYWEGFLKLYLLLAITKFFSLFLFKQYHFTWRYYGLYEAKKFILAHLLAYIISALTVFVAYPFFIPFPRSVLIIDFFLSLLFLLGFRFLKRIYLESFKKESYKTAIIYGLTPQTKHLINSFQTGAFEYKPILVVEDNPKSNYISGVKVISKKQFLKRTSLPKTLIVAKEVDDLDSLVEEFKKKGVEEFKIATLKRIKPIEIEDLLARKPKDLDKKAIQEFIKGKKVLITGAGGSIGSELVKQCLEFGAKEVIGVELNEFNLYQLNEKYPIVPILCDVTQKEEFKEVVRKYKPNLIIHAAAYKHVPLAELNPRATVKNNVLGTKNAIDIAIEEKVPHFVLISTDKAVNPTNIMGATKRVCELYAQNVNSKETTICAVRFGNVLGSSGSVIPKFKAQIERGEPLTVTHPEITRYFMLTSEACQLVLQSATIAKGKEVFILDMGKPVKIVDLAKKMIQLYNKKVEIKFIGLRPGEKLYEELLLEGAEEKTKYKSIFIAKPTLLDSKTLFEKIERLLKAKEKGEIIESLKTLVPEYSPKP